MRRRHFLEASMLAGSAQLAAQNPPPPREAVGGGTGSTSYQVQPTIERRQTGKPHQGKVIAAIQPHCDDIPIFAAGTLLKLIDEGYTAYLITMSDDSMAGAGATYGEIILKNEKDTIEVGKRLHCKQSLFLNYPNHNMDAWPIAEIRARLVYIFRALKIDTVMVYDPSALYERNPDHYVTARAVEWAAAIAGTTWDYPEHFLSGLKPHAPKERYYFARGPQLVNRVVDISNFMDEKVFVNLANVTQGPAGNTGAQVRNAWRSRERNCHCSARTMIRPTGNTQRISRWLGIGPAAKPMVSILPSTFTTSARMSRTWAMITSGKTQSRCRRLSGDVPARAPFGLAILAKVNVA